MTRESSVEAKSADNLRRLALARESAIALTLATDGALRLVGRDGEQRMNAAGGAVLFDADGKELATASKQAGQYACSYSAELRGAEVGIPLLGGRAPPGRVLWILDSLSLCQALAKGPIRQDSYAEAHIWRRILEYASQGWHFEIVWVFSHTGLRENDRADEVAEAAVANLPASEPPCWYVDAARHRANDALVRHNDSILALVDAGHPLATPRPVRLYTMRFVAPVILRRIACLRTGVWGKTGVTDDPQKCHLCGTWHASRRQGILHMLECPAAPPHHRGPFKEEDLWGSLARQIAVAEYALQYQRATPPSAVL